MKNSILFLILFSIAPLVAMEEIESSDPKENKSQLSFPAYAIEQDYFCEKQNERRIREQLIAEMQKEAKRQFRLRIKERQRQNEKLPTFKSSNYVTLISEQRAAERTE